MATSAYINKKWNFSHSRQDPYASTKIQRFATHFTNSPFKTKVENIGCLSLRRLIFGQDHCQ
ncbi:hypothetical protein [Anabaena sp. CCY 9614]|uniref:hypothetical protein n=1 Tax=Anabaena sp. CCY 9614 TaxID=3103869 RepID=UPI0039C5B37F